jgi:hypothetical protein
MGLMDLVKGTKLTGVFSSGSQIVSIIGNILVIGVVAAFIVGLVYIWKRKRSYNILSLIFSRRSGTLKFFTDKASYTKDKKTNLWDYRFKSLKETTSPPPYKVLLTGVKGGNIAVYYQNSAGELYPCEVNLIEPTGEEEVEMEVILPNGKIGKVKTKIAKCQLKIIEPDIALWSTQMDEKLLSTYGNQTWWDKYGNQVLFFGTATLIIVLIYLVLKKIDVVGEAARLFKESIEYLKASAVPIPSSAP